MSDEGGVGVFLLEKPVAELLFGIEARKYHLVAAFVLDHAEIWDVLSVVQGAFKIEEH